MDAVLEKIYAAIAEGKKVAYIAGPMRNIPDFNFPAFDEGKSWLLANLPDPSEWFIVSPADIDRERGIKDESGVGESFSPTSFQECMRIDLPIVALASAVLLLKGWENSTGGNNEVFTANACGVPLWVAAYNSKGEMDGFHVADGPLDPPLIVGDSVAPHSPQAATTGEVRIIDPVTGGQKGSKLARFDLLPWDVLYELAEHYGRGAEKYDDRNWERGYRWSLSIAALGRHLAAYLAGEDFDPETGTHHLVCVQWHAGALRWFQLHGKGTDDRSPG